MNQSDVKAAYPSPGAQVWERFKNDKVALVGTGGVLFLILVAVVAPFIANGRPLLMFRDGHLSLPFLRYLFAPDTIEVIVEKFFNYILFFSVPSAIAWLVLKKRKELMLKLVAIWALILVVPFIFVNPRLDKTDWRQACSSLKAGEFAIFAVVPYGPFENCAEPHLRPDRTHYFGTDQIGRDVLSRMVYGARVSLAVGFLATGLTMFFGILIGMICGYFGGRFDFLMMRIVEIIMCFPTFLLLLILMAIMMDRKYQQSILLVIAVIGLTSWTGLSRIVRGETLQQRSLPYIKACESIGVSLWNIMFRHILPNITGPILVSFTFGIAGSILAESGLSFLGFGVQAPTASWGELLRQAFSDPLRYWHLTLWPGLAIFIAVVSFNFAGEGLHRAFDPKSD
ncbi:MAG: ABC transporter permease [Victivallales bacterium]